jgi:hypothetical protein
MWRVVMWHISRLAASHRGLWLCYKSLAERMMFGC